MSLAAAARAAVERDIARRIHQFEVPALVDLLRALGYQPDEIQFRSHLSTTHPSSLLHAIGFHGEPHRHVVVLVNLGLLSTQSPLPSFFLRTLERQDDDSLLDFMGFFDHVLLERRFAAIFPERDASLVGDWDAALRAFLRFMRPASPSTLHWLMGAVFPELEVAVRRSTSRRDLATDELRLGRARLGGGGAFGGHASVPMGGVDAVLYAEEPLTSDGTPWAREVLRRLEVLVLPVLAETPLGLTVLLHTPDRHGGARLDDASYLGSDPLGDVPGRAREVILFSGEPSDRASWQLQAAA